MRNTRMYMFFLCMQLGMNGMSSLAMDQAQTTSPSEPGFVDMLKRGGKEIVDDVWWCGKTAYTILGSIASGIRWCYFDKPTTWEGFGKKKALATVFVVGSAYYARKHYLELQALDKKINLSKKATPGQAFLFGSWKSDDYKTAYAITTNKNSAVQALLTHAKKDGLGIAIYNNQGLVQPANVTPGDVCKALEAEKQTLENDLKVISRFTDLPLKIAEKVHENSGEAVHLNAWYYDKVSLSQTVVQYFQKAQNLDLDVFGQELLASCNASYVKHFLFIPPSWLRLACPHQWRLGVWYTKATDLYWKVYTTYLRTCALHDAVLAYEESNKEKEGNVIVNVNTGNSNSTLNNKNKNK